MVTADRPSPRRAGNAKGAAKGDAKAGAARGGQPAGRPFSRGGVLGLQRAAGNRATAAALGDAVVQRDPPLTTGAGQPPTNGGFTGLRDARWEGNALLDATARDKARVRGGSDPAAVRLVQQALVDVEAQTGQHYELGSSGPGADGVDGVYGATTGRAVQAFKRDESLGFVQFADVGPRTMHRLDDLLGGAPGPRPSGTEPDDPQRADPKSAKKPAPEKDELDQPKKAPATGLMETLIRVLSATPPDMLILFSTVRTLDIPTTYVAVHALHDQNPAQFAVLKSQVERLTVPLAIRLRVIADAVENDEDMAVLEWEQSRAAKLAALPKTDRDAILLAYDMRFPTLQKVLASTGFQSLPGPEQARFLVYVGGANLVSRRAGIRLGTVIDGAKFDRTKAATFRTYLKREESLKQIDDLTGKDPFTHRPVTLAAPVDVGKRPFRSKPGGVAAERVTVTVGAPADPDKATVPVFRPKAAALNAKLVYHSFADAAKGLSVLPPQNAKQVKRVEIEPAFNPDDPHWRKVYKNPEHVSYMTAGADGIISIYPSKTGQAASELWMMGSFIHESGHIIALKAFGNNLNGPKWKPWRDAMAADVLHPSDYATKSPSEDFSEMLLLARTVKGKRREQEIRKLFPARMAILDTMKLS